MTRLTPSISIGGQDCCQPSTATMAVLHACRNPCFCQHEGNPESETELWLDLIDAPAPELINGEAIQSALTWLRKQLFEERQVLIHCDSGEGRSAALALLTMAKVTGELPAGSFDEAWDALGSTEAIGVNGNSHTPISFNPSPGLEEYLRTNWQKLKVEPLCPPVEKAAPLEQPIPSEAEALALCMTFVPAHFEYCSYIRMKNTKLAKPTCNKLQVELFSAYMYLLSIDAPIFIVLLKARQSGGSEGTAELCYHHSRRFNLGGLMMADQHKRTAKIWDIFCLHGQHDDLGPFWPNRFSHNSEKAKIEWKDPDSGRKREVEWERDTALDPKAGASGTRHILWLSESARYAKEGKFRDTELVANLLSSVPPDMPKTMVIMESTAEGAGGIHHDTFEGGVTLEERQRGKVGNGWIKIFVPWTDSDDYRLVENRANAEFFDDESPEWVTFREDEQAGILRHGWTREQIAWRRKKIVSECGGDVALFRRDFPSTPEEAWSSSGSKRFNVLAVARMLVDAQALWEQALKGVTTAPKLGSLTAGTGASGVTFLPTREDAWLWVLETPEYGRSYALVIDPMTGEQSAGSDKRDNHACGVLRNEYVDERGVLHPAEIVAAIWLPGGCKWDMDILADRASLISRWYGRCVVIPEVNKGTDLIPYLRAHNVPLYQRTAKPDAENPSERLKVVGFLSTESTRRMWVSAAAEGIREGTLGCRFLPAVQEFDTFIVNAAGRAEAAPGAHDDWVAMYGIAKLCQAAATKMVMPVVYSQQGQNRAAVFAGKGSAALS